MNVAGIIAGSLMVVISLINIANPRLAWQALGRFYKNPSAFEPSELGLKVRRLVFAALLVIGIIILVQSL